MKNDKYKTKTMVLWGPIDVTRHITLIGSCWTWVHNRGVQGQILDFLVFHKCQSPDYLFSKMGLFVSQLARVAKI